MHTVSPMSHAPDVRRRRAASDRLRATHRPPTLFPVFIAYADVPAARRAMELFAARLRTIHSSQRLQPMLWRFDQLNQRRWREMALSDAIRAAAVVIALSDDVPLNTAAETWLTTLAVRHHGARVNLVAVLNGEAWSISLQQSTGEETSVEPPVQLPKKENPAAYSTPPDEKIPVSRCLKRPLSGAPQRGYVDGAASGAGVAAGAVTAGVEAAFSAASCSFAFARTPATPNEMPTATTASTT